YCACFRISCSCVMRPGGCAGIVPHGGGLALLPVLRLAHCPHPRALRALSLSRKREGTVERCLPFPSPACGRRRRDAQDEGAPARQAEYPLLIGYRRSRPNARRDTFGPGAAWWRFHSEMRTSFSTLSTVAASKPAATISSRDCSWSTWRSRIASSTS